MFDSGANLFLGLFGGRSGVTGFDQDPVRIKLRKDLLFQFGDGHEPGNNYEGRDEIGRHGVASKPFDHPIHLLAARPCSWSAPAYLQQKCPTLWCIRGPHFLGRGLQ